MNSPFDLRHCLPRYRVVVVLQGFFFYPFSGASEKPLFLPGRKSGTARSGGFPSFDWRLRIYYDDLKIMGLQSQGNQECQ
jgi:hypothetical protein